MKFLDEDKLHERRAGIQLAIFELVWPSFTWIERIYLETSLEKLVIHVEAAEPQAHVELEDCAKILEEVFFSFDPEPRINFIAPHSKPLGNKLQELMSQAIFERLAKDVAPWRLESGR